MSLNNINIDNDNLAEDGLPKCKRCRSIGELGRKCPKCGRMREPVRVTVSEEEEQVFITDTKELDGARNFQVIPTKYEKISWDRQTLIDCHPELCGEYTDFNFTKYCDKLKGFVDIFKRGAVPTTSGFIIAPPGFSKITLAYDCLKIARDHGYTIAPILDTGEIKQLIQLSNDRPGFKLFGKISYEEYIMADVLFITVIKTYEREWSYQIIQQLIDARSRKGLATIILSRYTPFQLAGWDRQGEFNAALKHSTTSASRSFGVIKYGGNINVEQNDKN